MTRGTPLRHALPAAAAFAALAALGPDPAGAAEVACRENRDYVVEVDGEYPPDTRFFETDTNGKFLVDIPSRSKSVLLDVPAGRAIPVPRTSLRTETIDGTVRVREPGGSDPPASRLAIEGSVLAFQIDASKVRVLKVTERPPVAGSVGTKAPAAGGVPARSCLRIESRPVPGVPGCGRFVYLKNTCEVHVVAEIGRIEHLFSGTLPQTFSLVAPPASEQSLGCAWWSGAMAPTEYELLAARSLDAPTRPPNRPHQGPNRP